MSDQTKIQTIGPADPNAPVAQKFYTVLAALGSLVGVASTFGMVTGEQAASLGQVSTTGTAFVLAVGTAIASFRTKKQVNNGTFDEAPPDPVGNVFEQLGILKDHVDRTVADVTDQVTNAAAVIQGAVSSIPGGAAVTNAVFSGPVGDLIQAMVDRDDADQTQ